MSAKTLATHSLLLRKLGKAIVWVVTRTDQLQFEYTEKFMLGAPLYITASRLTALAEGVPWASPSSLFEAADVKACHTPPETDQQLLALTVAWALLHWFIVYASIERCTNTVLPNSRAALLLSIPPLLVPHKYYALGNNWGIAGLGLSMMYGRLCQWAVSLGAEPDFSDEERDAYDIVTLSGLFSCITANWNGLMGPKQVWSNRIGTTLLVMLQIGLYRMERLLVWVVNLVVYLIQGYFFFALDYA